MNEIKNIVFVIIAFIVWSAACVSGGYLYSNRTSVQLINAERARSAEKDREYEQSISAGKSRIAELERRISETGSQLGNEIQLSKVGVGNVLSILEEVGSQRFTVQEDSGRWYIVEFSSDIFKVKE